MNLYYPEEHTSCANYISNSPCGFKLITLKKGEKTSDDDHLHDNYNLIIFILNGEIEFSCNQYMNRRFISGELLFVPRSTIVSYRTLQDSKLIVLLFDYTVTNLCDKYTLKQYITLCPDVVYDFKGLKIRSPLDEFLKLLEMFLVARVNCIHLHEIKQKELFIIFRTAYNRDEITNLFYPILGNDANFKSSVLAHYKVGYSAKEMASAMALSEANFSRKFKQEFHITYYQWMLKQKAHHIKYKLADPSITIKEVIQEFNFANFSHFNRFCKEYFGDSPSELIKSLRSNKTVK